MGENPEKEEYELQFFNVCSEDMIDQNRFMLKSLIQSTLVNYTDTFLENYKVPDETAMEMRSKCHEIAGKLFAESGPQLEELDELYRKTFSIPDNVLLPSDFLQKRACTAEQLEAMQAKVDAMEGQLRQEGVFLAMLQDELKLHDGLAQCRESEGQLMDLVDEYRQEEIVPEEECALVDDLAKLMEEVMRS